jgi:two-component sensor histidine kinase/HPt (histidine-containing phosphotransfer) domain-containing protein
LETEIHLREKAKLLLQRERELFEMRAKHEQIAVWLSLGQSLPELFANRDAALVDICDRLRRMLLTKLRIQRIFVFEVQPGALQPMAPAGPQRSCSAELAALLEAQPAGMCNEPSEPAMLLLAEVLGLHRFIWSRITPSGGVPLLMVAGFERNKARFQAPFVANDVAHFANAAQHVQSLLANALLVRELQQERDHLRRTNLALEQRDRELEIATEQLRAANESLERRIRERTQELAGKNRELHLVLDNVDQALMTIDLEGRLSSERSSMAQRWFGADRGQGSFVEYVAADEKFAEQVGIGLEFLRDAVLPCEVCLEHLPKRLAVNQREFECRYLPIGEEEPVTGLLVVIDDITERLARKQEEVEQRELLAAFTALTRDRKGFLAFFAESEGMIADLSRAEADKMVCKHVLHTLKGNTSTFGLHAVAALCHAAETELATDARPRTETLDRLRTRWSGLAETLKAVGSAGLQNSIEVSEADLARLTECARTGASARYIISELQCLRWELIERPLRRLGQHASAIARRLGKGEIDVRVEADEVRLDPARWAPLWSALIHLVRNALDHGIESPEQRSNAGKSARGRLRLAARRVDGNLYLAIEDDGRGIDWGTVRRLCEERGLSSSTQSDLVRALISPDFSTCREVTELSGRGVGLAAVAAVAAQLGGTLSVDTPSFQGTRWQLTFPIDGSVVAAAVSSELNSRAPVTFSV